MKTDTEILTKIIEALKLNPRSFSIELGYASASTIYNITKGPNKISEDLKNRIRLKFPEVNRLFLDKGEGEPILRGPQYTNQQNIQNIFPATVQSKITTLEDLLALPHTVENIGLMVKRNYETLERISANITEISEILKKLKD